MAISILNIGGHSKDAIMYAGGTLAKHAANGDRVCTLTPTHPPTHPPTACLTTAGLSTNTRSPERPTWGR